MGREFKPGDVARIRVGTGDWEFGLMLENGEWACQHLAPRKDFEDVQAEPIVVVDPGEPEQVERVRDALLRAMRQASNPFYEPALLSLVQIALASLVEPPRPPEPQGLGAVVEDEEGIVWIRHHGELAPWHRADAGGNERAWRYWPDIAVREIKSQGWSE